ncbi:MAG: GTP-binding protein [Nitrospirae bacterium]|nr:GTP-binding protein [Nitrospirota bacterium]
MSRKVVAEKLQQKKRALSVLSGCAASREDQTTLERSIRQLDDLFLLVVVGEFNAGKSTFINALLGRQVLPDGVTPTTTRIHHLKYGETDGTTVGEDGIEEITAPVEILEEVHIVDTPGTNALDRDHEAITSDFVPRADLLLFVTSVDRPFTESERNFMNGVRQWGKKLVFVVNKIDILQSDDDLSQVVDYVSENGERLLGFAPQVFPVSSQQALTAKMRSELDQALLEHSRFPPLESYLLETLDESERIRLKLLNPIGVGKRLADTYYDATESRLEVLAEDFAAIDHVGRQLDLYGQDMSREFRYRLTDVDNILHEFERRGMEYFDETLRLARAVDLMNKAKIKADFERQVIGRAPQEIEKKVNEIIDWMVEAELRQWKGVSDNLSKRRIEHDSKLVGEIGSFEYDRQKLLETVGRAAQEAVDGYSRAAEIDRMAESVRTAVAGTAIIEVSALGLGAIITLMATTQLADVTGLMAAGTLALLGLFVLPARRRRAKKELSNKILRLREKLMSSLTEQFEREIERSRHRIEEAIAPYTRFVKAERQKLEELTAELGTAKDSLASLQDEVEKL